MSLGSLGEIDSMVATLSTMYKLDQETLDGIELLRRQVTAGIFRLLRRGRT